MHLFSTLLLWPLDNISVIIGIHSGSAYFEDLHKIYVSLTFSLAPKGFSNKLRASQNLTNRVDVPTIRTFVFIINFHQVKAVSIQFLEEQNYSLQIRIWSNELLDLDGSKKISVVCGNYLFFFLRKVIN